MSESQTVPETSEKGLTAAEVAALTESGQVNAVKSSTSRSFADIVRANVFTLFNGIIFAAMVMVLVTGSWRDAVFGLVAMAHPRKVRCTQVPFRPEAVTDLNESTNALTEPTWTSAFPVCRKH